VCVCVCVRVRVCVCLYVQGAGGERGEYKYLVGLHQLVHRAHRHQQLLLDELDLKKRRNARFHKFTSTRNGAQVCNAGMHRATPTHGTHTHTHTRTHTRTHTHAHPHTRTHSHTHTHLYKHHPDQVARHSVHQRPPDLRSIVT